jgi:gluconolactonase
LRLDRGASTCPSCTNLCFGGTYRNRLFMCGGTSLYSLYVNTQGAPEG